MGLTKTLAAVAALVAAGAAAAADLQPAVIYDMGGKFDKSFNEAAYSGAERFKTETGVEYSEFEITNETQREQAMRNFARRGRDPIVVAGFTQAEAVKKVAADFPDTRFTIIDAVVDLPNVQSVLFKEEEGSYLVGMLAAMKSDTKKVGFVGGMDIGLIRKFACGYVQGAKAAGATDVFQNMTGTTPAAWSDPVKGSELAQSQFGRGADVVYAAAGGTGLGVLQAAEDAGKFSIGVDSNQNHLHPGSVLTSMVKRVDVAVSDTFKSAMDGTWEPGVKVFGLAEDGVGYVIDEHNEDLVTEEMKQKLEQARADIMAGKIEVHDYMTDNTCPA